MARRIATATAAPSLPLPPRLKVKSVVAADRLDQLIEHANSEVRHLTATLAKWQEEFAKDPAHALEWSSNTFRDAARIKMAKEVITFLGFLRAGDEYSQRTEETAIRIVHTEMIKEALRKARYPEHSTSVPSNEMALAVNAARCEWLEHLDRAVAAIDGAL